MNKLDLSFLGGHPITLDDLEFLQNALTEGIKGAISPFQFGGSDPVILAGIIGTISGLNTNFTAGFIVVNGEVYYVPAATVVTASPICIDIAETIDTAGDVTYEDLATHSTYLVRKGLLKNTAGSPTEIDIADFITIRDKLRSITNCVVNTPMSWTNSTMSGSWAYASGGAYAGNAVRHGKNALNEIKLDGLAYCAFASIAPLIMNLPAGFRPAEMKVFSVYIGDTGTSSQIPGFITIEPNGDVKVYSSSSPVGNWIVSLCGISIN